MRETLRYPEPNLGDGVEVAAPREWSALSRANAVCELAHGHPLTEWLAILSLVASGGNRRLAASALVLGWSPGQLLPRGQDGA